MRPTNAPTVAPAITPALDAIQEEQYMYCIMFAFKKNMRKKMSIHILTVN